jgi:tRNA (Thr-GGU) A37 N-methylase
VYRKTDTFQRPGQNYPASHSGKLNILLSHGVFATRSPVRPNLLGLQACRLIRRESNRLEVEGLDAWEGSPVLDIKPYLPRLDSHPEAVVPKWAEGKPPE